MYIYINPKNKSDKEIADLFTNLKINKMFNYGILRYKTV